MDEGLKPIRKDEGILIKAIKAKLYLDKLYHTLRPGYKSQWFKPHSLKDALHYVHYKDKRDKILQSIDNIKQSNEVTQDLWNKFTLLFKTNLVVSTIKFNLIIESTFLKTSVLINWKGCNK